MINFSTLLGEFKKKLSFFSLLILLTIISVSHLLYVVKTHQFPANDEHYYIQYAVDMLPILKKPSLKMWSQIMELTRYRQPLYPLFIALPLLIFGTSQAYKIALILNGVFYLITIVAVYFLSREFFDKKIAFLAAFIFCFNGFSLFYLHFAYTETAVTAFVSLALLFLKRSENFSKVKATFLFSVFSTIAILIRWVAPIFIFGPFIINLIFSLKNQIDKKTRNIKNFSKNLFAFFIAGILPTLLFYYLPRFSYFKDYITGNIEYGSIWAVQLLNNPALKNTWSKPSLIWYGNILAQQTIFFFILFIIGILIAFKNFKKYKFILSAIAFPYFVFTLGSAWKDDRFIVTIYPSMAIACSLTIEVIKKQTIQRVVMTFVIILGFLNFLGASWGIGPMGKEGLKSIVIPMPIGHPRRIYLSPIVWPPRQNQTNHEQLINTIVKSHDYSSGKKPNVLMTFDSYYIEGNLYKTARYEQPELFRLVTLFNLDKCKYHTLFHRIKEADYVLVKTGKFFEKDNENSVDIIKVINQVLRFKNAKLPSAFVPIKTIYIPIDKSNLTIYKRTTEVSSEEIKQMFPFFLKADPSFKNSYDEETSLCI